MNTPTRLAAVLLASTLAGLALAGTAGAGDVATYDTRLKMFNSFPAFHGEVNSEGAMCVAGRRVKLFRKRRPGRPPRLLGTDRSSMTGEWAITEPDDFTLTSGLYYARVKRKIVDTGIANICRADKSRRIVVD